ncbi:hypothetical protein FA15DRAFT_659582 [Coprinopsis marcescibilis]|uniref:Uncharacterized protein n=1 Tax=Coprinopsis marcescibilis TaxID=230819 RepID=A0A5C3KI45_COPMA|nr:hypothetical protein FA15DRAFT_659582 [Coprinopsis marcescibilis]
MSSINYNTHSKSTLKSASTDTSANNGAKPGGEQVFSTLVAESSFTDSPFSEIQATRSPSPPQPVQPLVGARVGLSSHTYLLGGEEVQRVMSNVSSDICFGSDSCNTSTGDPSVVLWPITSGVTTTACPCLRSHSVGSHKSRSFGTPLNKEQVNIVTIAQSSLTHPQKDLTTQCNECIKASNKAEAKRCAKQIDLRNWGNVDIPAQELDSTTQKAELDRLRAAKEAETAAADYNRPNTDESAHNDGNEDPQSKKKKGKNRKPERHRSTTAPISNEVELMIDTLLGGKNKKCSKKACASSTVDKTKGTAPCNESRDVPTKSRKDKYSNLKLSDQLEKKLYLGQALAAKPKNCSHNKQVSSESLSDDSTSLNNDDGSDDSSSDESKTSSLDSDSDENQPAIPKANACKTKKDQKKKAKKGKSKSTLKSIPPESISQVKLIITFRRLGVQIDSSKDYLTTASQSVFVTSSMQSFAAASKTINWLRRFTDKHERVTKWKHVVQAAEINEIAESVKHRGNSFRNKMNTTPNFSSNTHKFKKWDEKKKERPLFKRTELSQKEKDELHITISSGTEEEYPELMWTQDHLDYRIDHTPWFRDIECEYTTWFEDPLATVAHAQLLYGIYNAKEYLGDALYNPLEENDLKDCFHVFRKPNSDKICIIYDLLQNKETVILKMLLEDLQFNLHFTLAHHSLQSLHRVSIKSSDCLKTLHKVFTKSLETPQSSQRLFKDSSETLQRLFEDSLRTLQRLFEDSLRTLRRLCEESSETLQRLCLSWDF